MTDLVTNRCSDTKHDAQQPYVARWLPIETADKSEDATPIDVWQVSTYKGEIVGQRRIADVIWDGEDWVSDEHGDHLEWADKIGQQTRITHWMPLPAAPLSPTAGRRHEESNTDGQ